MSEREKFERTYLGRFDLRHDMDAPAGYYSMSTDTAWVAWQDRAAIAVASQQALPKVAMTDEQIGAIFDELGGVAEFCKGFGYLQFARRIEAESAPIELEGYELESHYFNRLLGRVVEFGYEGGHSAALIALIKQWGEGMYIRGYDKRKGEESGEVQQ